MSVPVILLAVNLLEAFFIAVGKHKKQNMGSCSLTMRSLIF
jgi:hypothetical protein